MAYCNTVLAQVLNMIPRHEFETMVNDVDGKVRTTVMSRWSQFVAVSVGRLYGRQTRRDNVLEGSVLVFDKGYNNYRWLKATISTTSHL